MTIQDRLAQQYHEPGPCKTVNWDRMERINLCVEEPATPIVLCDRLAASYPPRENETLGGWLLRAHEEPSGETMNQRKEPT